MKRIIITAAIAFATITVNAQNFASNVTTAKTAYSSGKLEDAHFALQQALVELDITIGKEVLKLLPAKVDSLTALTKDDNVTGNVAFLGATIHRNYSSNRNVSVDIVSNSPLVSTLNAFLTSPLLNIGSNGNTKVIKVQGYKARLSKEDGGEGGKPNYRLEMPFNNSLITIAADHSSEAEIMSIANAIQFAGIAKLIG